MKKFLLTEFASNMIRFIGINNSLAFLLLLTGCGNGLSLAPPLPVSVAPHVRAFHSLASKHGKPIAIDTVNIQFSNGLNENTLGVCKSSGVIYLNRSRWNALNVTQRRIVLFHELGHCYLGRGHTRGYNASRGIPKSIMNADLFYFSHYLDNTAYYHAELFR